MEWEELLRNLQFPRSDKIDIGIDMNDEEFNNQEQFKKIG